MSTGRGIGQDHLSIPEKLRLVSWPLLLLVTLTACIGFASLYSAAGGHMAPWAGKQAARFVFGLFGLVVVALIDIRAWMKMSYPLYALGILLLVYVDIRGHIGMGAQRWISLGFLELQPSEVVKITTVMALARCFHAATAEDVRNPLFLLLPLALAALPAGLVAIQPDLGTALTIVLVAGGIFFLAGVPYWMFGAVVSAGLAALPVLWHFMHDYQKKRILVFLHPERDPLGAGYHIMQSKIALGSGGVFGKGFLHGSQSHLDFLPEKQTDFIFTLFAEEWGLIGGLTLMALFMAIIAYGYFIALNCQNQYARLLGLGVIVNFFVYIFINIGMVMGLLPVVGVPLPLVSYGGTAMLSVLFGFGLLMSAHVHRDVKFTRTGLDPA
ncbi:MAG: rod shape-determining protein RodA [Alphaproteobacteria bacterium]|nr:rod shape-determining protein RodA [Alphaproteobacteria bacterium]MDE2336913.1 rod shape-determining protein RodA [Alphaproteobacteria bacterium]